MALVSLASIAFTAGAWQSLNTDAEYELVNAYRDGRLWVAVIVVVILAMLFKQMRGR
ncbi:MAG TPA: hypothetical protein VH679_07385 [Vicinamibacterales bacterium]